MTRPTAEARAGTDGSASDDARVHKEKPRTVPLPAQAAAVVAGALVLRFAWRWLRGPKPGCRRLGPNQPLTSGPGEVSVLTYNIMTDTPGRLAACPSPQQAAWDKRWPAVLRVLEDADADVICLQEVTMQHWEQVHSALAGRGYDGVLSQRLAAVAPGSSTTVLATFFKRERTPTLAILTIVNLHLEQSPYLAGVRVEQLSHALARLAVRLCPGRPRALPGTNLILAGELDCGAGSCWNATWRLLRTGRLDALWTEPGLPGLPVNERCLEQPFPLVGVEDAAGPGGECENSLTNDREPEDNSTKLPHTLLRQGDLLCSRGMQVNAIRRPWDRAIIAETKLKGVPCDACPSDRLPMGAVLRLAREPGGPAVR